MATAYSAQHILAGAPASQPGTIQLSFTRSEQHAAALRLQTPAEQLLFSPDGTQLLAISTHTLTVLSQSPAQADHWTPTSEHPLPPGNTHIPAAAFITQTPRAFTEPVRGSRQPPSPIRIGDAAYHQLRRIPATPFAPAHGHTAVLVLSTTQLFILHLPPPGSNLPPHTLLTALDEHTVAPLAPRPVPAEDHARRPTKQTIVAAIGLPPTARRGAAAARPAGVLIAFQSLARPAVPASQPVLRAHDEGRAKPAAECQTMAEPEDFITGLGDLDDAFDPPAPLPCRPKPSSPTPSQTHKPAKHRPNSPPLTRRVEPRPPCEPAVPALGPHSPQPSFAPIQLVELLLDFDHPPVPNVTVRLLPRLPISDPFAHAGPAQAALLHLAFVPCLRDPSAPAGHRRRRGRGRAAARGRLRPPARPGRRRRGSAGRAAPGLGRALHAPRALRGLPQPGRASRRAPEPRRPGALGPAPRARRMGMPPPQPGLQRTTDAPASAQVFARVAHRALLAPPAGLAEPRIRVRKLVPQWPVREGCFLLLVEKRTRAAEGDEAVEHECWVLNGRDLSTVAVKPLPGLEPDELAHASISFHGVWCCTLDGRGKVRMTALGTCVCVSAEEQATVVGLVVSALHNRHPVDDIARLLAHSARSPTPPAAGEPPAHLAIFRDVGTFIAHFYAPGGAFDLDPYLPVSWSLAHDLWRSVPSSLSPFLSPTHLVLPRATHSVIPGYESAAELALIGRQLTAVLAIGTAVRMDSYSGSVWQMVGLARWYVRLCQRIIGSIDPAMSGCSFYFLFKITALLSNFNNWLKQHGSSAGGGPHYASPNILPEACPPPTADDQPEIAKVVFAELWEHQNAIQMETFGKLLQDIGRATFPKQPGELFIPRLLPRITALDPALVQESVRDLRELVSRHPMLIKPSPTPAAASAGTPAPGPKEGAGPSTTPPTTPPPLPAPPSATLPPAPSQPAPTPGPDLARGPVHPRRPQDDRQDPQPRPRPAHARPARRRLSPRRPSGPRPLLSRPVLQAPRRRQAVSEVSRKDPRRPVVVRRPHPPPPLRRRRQRPRDEAQKPRQRRLLAQRVPH
ncbi:hypothetical protein PTTG_28798 [Puccinia triticina 1-1 BBBD Race 1]|uniref:Uncharacterized protein n=1 Tax=Puccinia triticina (isolate 1-1 / race 1 (BBBD)) TaxID=630390 RepID=A0A180G9E9_PUCT1|nr:hypothetical protein PTTG_28798 [Puccinia triticina 1-1 BBBD Race 1]